MIPATGKRVLVVEDEALLSMVIESFLEEMGWQVAGTAARLEDALIKARALTLDVALLDVNLDGELSYPVAEALRARGIPFIFATGYNPGAFPDGLRSAPLLTKPFGQQDLVTALHEVVGRARV